MDNITLPHPELEALKQSIRLGRSEGMRDSIRKFRAHNPDWLEEPAYSWLLVEAIQHRQPYIRDILLSEQVPVSVGAVEAAAKARRREDLAALFDNGWNVNTPLNDFRPPILM